MTTVSPKSSIPEQTAPPPLSLYNLNQERLKRLNKIYCLTSVLFFALGVTGFATANTLEGKIIFLSVTAAAFCLFTGVVVYLNCKKLNRRLSDSSIDSSSASSLEESRNESSIEADSSSGYYSCLEEEKEEERNSKVSDSERVSDSKEFYLPGMVNQNV